MRRQDELLSVYPGQDPLTARFILCQLEELALAFDSDEILEFFQGEIGSPVGEVRRQALLSLARFLPSFIRKRYALSPQAQGLWSSAAGIAPPPPALLDAPDDPAVQARYHGAFLRSARAIPDALIRLVPTTRGPARTGVLLALAQYPLERSFACLEAVARSAPEEFESVLPLALISETSQTPGDLEQILREQGPANPDHLLLVASLERERASRAIFDWAARVGPLGRMNLAQALGHIRDIDHNAAVKHLVSFKEGWVAAHALRSLDALGDPGTFHTVHWIHSASRSPFLRGLAIRAAGGLRCPEAIGFCLRSLEQDGEEVAPQAIESLIRLRCDPDVIQRIASRHTSSTSLRLRVTALLASYRLGGGGLPEPVEELLLSEDALSRLEGAFCLGYLQTEKSVPALITIAERDPVLQVRLHAVKSLSKYPPADVLRALTRLVRSVEPRVALTAGRVLARYEGEEAPAACAGLEPAIRKATGGFERGILLRALGIVAGRCGYLAAVKALAEGLEHPDPKVARGAVEGYNALGCLASPEVAAVLDRLAAGEDPRLVPRAVLARYKAGSPAALGRLAALMEPGAMDRVAAAVETALELGLLASRVGLWKRFPSLLESLAGQVREGPASGVLRVRDEDRSPPRDSPEAGVSRAGDGFTVQTVPGPLRTSPGHGAAASSQAIEVVEIPRLTLYLDGLQERVSGQIQVLGRRVREFTDLVGDHMIDPGALGGTGRHRRTAGVILGILVCVGLARAVLGPWTASPAGAVGSPLQVTLVHGEVTVDPGRRQLQVGDGLAAGDSIRTRARSRVHCLSRHGSSISVGPSSVATLERVDDSGAGLSISLGPGRFIFSAPPGAALTVNLANRSLVSREGVFSVEPDPRGGELLVVDAGTVQVRDGATVQEEIGTGRYLWLPPP